MGTVARLSSESVDGMAKCVHCTFLSEGKGLVDRVQAHIEADRTHQVLVVRAESVRYGWVD